MTETNHLDLDSESISEPENTETPITGNRSSQPGEDLSQEPALQPEAVPPSRPGFFKRAIHFLFNPETRFGRSMRAITRTLAMIVGFFGLGFLIAYILLYRPTDQALTLARSDLQSTQSQLDTARDSLATSQDELKKTREQTEIQQVRIEVLSMLNMAQTTKLALVTKDSGNTAKESIQAAAVQLDNIFPTLTKIDPDAAVNLKARLDLVKNEMGSDPKTAAADLNMLIEKLRILDQQLSK